MSTSRGMMIAGVVLCAACWGCERLNVSLNYQEPRPVVYTQVDVGYIDAGHICSRGCSDHFYNGSEVVVLRGHRHGYGCGHRWNGSHWGAAVSLGHARVVHVCDRQCHNHYWNGSSLVSLGSGHHHNAQCGHRWDGNHWIVVRAPRHRVNTHVNVAPRVSLTTTHHHGPACGCVYNRAGSKWVKVSAGHIHGRNCGHVLHQGRWSVSTNSSHHNNRVKIRPKRIKRRH